MSLLLAEGFDDGAYRGRTTTNSGDSTTGGRTGSALSGPAAGFGIVIWSFGASEEHATFIVGLAYRANTLASHSFLFLRADSGATTHITLSTNSAGKLTVSGLGSTDNGVIKPNRWHYIEVYVVLSDTVGEVKLRVDGKTPSGWSDLTNVDTKSGGTATVFDSVELRCDNSGASYIDDVYICNGAGSVNNDLLGDIRVETLYPDGNGNYSQLTGSDGNSVDNYQQVDEAVPSSSDYNGSPTDGNKDTYAFEDLAASVDSVFGVMVSMWAAKSDTGAKSCRAVARRNAVDATGGDKTLQTTYAPHDQVWDQDPTDSTSWTPAKVNDMEFGFEVRP